MLPLVQVAGVAHSTGVKKAHLEGKTPEKSEVWCQLFP